MGITKFDKLTLVNISLELDLMSIVLKLWKKKMNSLVPFGLTSITLRDIVIFIGVPIFGIDVLGLFNVHDHSLP